jgi:hypothetical protein
MNNESKNPYSERYLDPRWQRKKSEIMQRDHWCCTCCKDGTSCLYVHHHYYIANRDPWEYPDWALITLCEACHLEHHANPNQRYEWERYMTAFSTVNCEMLAEIIEECVRVAREDQILPTLCKLASKNEGDDPF